jgi:hypothetical protein
MKFCLVVLILTCRCVVSAQSLPFDFPFLGQPVERFKDSIICMDANRLNQTYEKSKGCMSFRLVSNGKELYGFGDLRFQTIIISPDSTGLVNYIAYFISGNTDKIIEETETGFAELSVLFKSKFPNKAKREIENSEYNFTRRLTWQTGSSKLILSHTTAKKNKKRKKFCILTVDVLL